MPVGVSVCVCVCVGGVALRVTAALRTHPNVQGHSARCLQQVMVEAGWGGWQAPIRVTRLSESFCHPARAASPGLPRQNRKHLPARLWGPGRDRPFRPAVLAEGFQPAGPGPGPHHHYRAPSLTATRGTDKDVTVHWQVDWTHSESAPEREPRSFRRAGRTQTKSRWNLNQSGALTDGLNSRATPPAGAHEPAGPAGGPDPDFGLSVLPQPRRRDPPASESDHGYQRSIPIPSHGTTGLLSQVVVVSAQR